MCPDLHTWACLLRLLCLSYLPSVKHFVSAVVKSAVKLRFFDQKDQDVKGAVDDSSFHLFQGDREAVRG